MICISPFVRSLTCRSNSPYGVVNTPVFGAKATYRHVIFGVCARSRPGRAATVINIPAELAQMNRRRDGTAFMAASIFENKVFFLRMYHGTERDATLGYLR